MTDKSFKNFLSESKDLIDMLSCSQRLIHNAIAGNKLAAKKSRVILVEIEKKGKIYRKDSIQHITRFKKYG